jgi:hypothetical protein
MTDGSETIYAWQSADDFGYGGWSLTNDFEATSKTEYIRTDIYNDAIEEKDERIEELEQDCEIISSEFESDLWVVCRRLLTKTHFDFSHAHVDGIHTDEFEGHMNETLSEFDRTQARIAELEAANDAAEQSGQNSDGGLWRFWADKSLKLATQNAALQKENATLKAKP